MKSLHIAVVALTVSAIAATALAHDGATGIVKDRMDAMSNIGKAVKGIAEMIRGKVPYNAGVVKTNAMIIKKHSGTALTSLFPDNSLEKPSEARKEIWSNWDEFSELSARLEILASGLEAAADNGIVNSNASKKVNMPMKQNNTPDIAALAKMPVDGVFMMLAKTCGTCHEKFRLKKE